MVTIPLDGSGTFGRAAPSAVSWPVPSLLTESPTQGDGMFLENNGATIEGRESRTHSSDLELPQSINQSLPPNTHTHTYIQIGWGEIKIEKHSFWKGGGREESSNQPHPACIGTHPVEETWMILTLAKPSSIF